MVVLESHYRAGGCTHGFNEIGDGGDVFDTGIHYVGMGPILRRLLSHVSAPGKPMRFAAIGSPSDQYTYDEIHLGEVPSLEGQRWDHVGQTQGLGGPESQGEELHSGLGALPTHRPGPSGWGASFDLDCEEEYNVDLECEEERRVPGKTAAVATGFSTDQNVEEGSQRIIVKLRKGQLTESLVEAFPKERKGIEAYLEAVHASSATLDGGMV